MNKLLLISTFITLGFFSCSGQSDKEEKEVVIQRLSPAEFKEVIKSEDVQLVDVRTLQEVKRGKIGDAIHIDFLKPDFLEQVKKLDKEKPVALYCAVGGRSARAANQLSSLGFKKIYDLSGGYKAFVD